MSKKEKNEAEIEFAAVLQMLGKPKEHLVETMEKLIEKLKEDNRFNVNKSTISDAEEVESTPGMYSLIADIEVNVASLSHVYDFIFAYTPASIEIIHPQNLHMPAMDISGALNDFIARLHEVDMFAREQAHKNELITKDVRTLISNSILLALANKPSTVEKLAKAVGIGVKEIEPFLKKLVGDKRITKKDDTYAIIA